MSEGRQLVFEEAWPGVPGRAPLAGRPHAQAVCRGQEPRRISVDKWGYGLALGVHFEKMPGTSGLQLLRKIKQTQIFEIIQPDWKRSLQVQISKRKLS